MKKTATLIIFILLSCNLHAADISQNQSVQNLLDIYTLALSHDPVLASALSTNKASQEKLEQGKALYHPTVNFEANASHSQTDIKYLGNNSVFRNGGQESFDTYSYGLTINQPIFRKQNMVLNQQAKTQVMQADKQLLLAQQNLILRVAQAYFEVLMAQDKITLAGAQKTAIHRQLEQAQANFEVGNATITDVNESQARYDLIHAQEIAAFNEFEIKKRTVQSIIGEMPRKLASIHGTVKTSLPEPQDMEQWVAIAEQNNLALQIQQQALELATQEMERNQAAHLPTLDAIASYTSTRADGSANGFGSDLQSAVIGLKLEIPLYQGGALTSKVREAVALKQKAQDDVTQTRRQIGLETRQAYLNLASSIAQVAAYEQALKSSQSQLDSTSLGYEVGVRTSVDVLNAQQQLYSAKRDLLQARYDYLITTLKLKSASGLLSPADLTAVNQQLGNSDTSEISLVIK